MSQNVIDILSACGMFAEVAPRSFQRLVAMARLARYAKNQTIFRQNDACPGVFVVGKGLVRVFKRGPGGKEHILHMVGPGGTFAEVAAVGDFPVPAEAEAVTETVCAVLPTEPFRRALAEDHQLCLDLLATLALWVRRLVNLVEDIALRDAAGRLARYLLDQSAPAPREGGKTDPAGGEDAEGVVVELAGLKRHIASHLNLTSETFSRTLRRLIDAGLVAEAGSAQLRLLDRRALGRVAEGLFPRL